MIQKMKKITLLTLESYKQEMLDQLSELSVMHITVDRKKAGQGEAARYLHELDQISKAQFLLDEFKKTDVPQKELPAVECLAELLNCIAKAETLKANKNRTIIFFIVITIYHSTRQDCLLPGEPISSKRYCQKRRNALSRDSGSV